jgi:hypothetical protein
MDSGTARQQASQKQSAVKDRKGSRVRSGPPMPATVSGRPTAVGRWSRNAAGKLSYYPARRSTP